MLLHRHIVRSLISACLLAAASAARGQVLADRLPNDAVAYVGWAGSDVLGTAYDASHLKAILETLNLPALLSQRLQAGIARINDPQRAENAKLLADLAAALAKSPTALYVGPVDFSNPAQPVPKIALVSKVGAELAAKWADPLSTAMALNRPPNGPPSGAVAVDDFLLIYVGDAKFPERLSGPAPERSLAHEDNFKHTLAQLGPDAPKSAALVYLDAESAVRLLENAAQTASNPQVRDLLPVISDGMGLHGLKQFAWAGNFDGADWKSAAFLGMRERRVGLLAFVDNTFLSEDSLKLIPQSATTAGIVRFDGPRLLDDITAAAAKVSDQAPKQLETALTQAYIWTGIDLKRQLLPAFGSEFIYYASPAPTGNSLSSFTIINRLNDAKKADAAASAVENFLNLLILQRNPNSKLQFRTQSLPAPWDAITAHIMTLPQATPCWAINGDIFYFSLSLPGLQSAMEMGASNKPNITANPQFAALRQRLGQERFASFSFNDYSSSAAETYALARRLVTGPLAQNTVAGQPVYDLPPLDKILPALAPSLNVSWSDADGYHAKGLSPFPGSGLLSPASYLSLLALQQARQAQQIPPAQTAPNKNTGLP